MDLRSEIVKNVNIQDLHDAFSKQSKDEKIGALTFVFANALLNVDILIHPDSNVYHWFDGRIYIPILDKDIEFSMRSAMLECQVSKGVVVKEFKKMMTHIWMSASSRKLNPSRALMCFTNCIFDVRKGKRYEFSPSIHVINKLPYEYNESSECQKWHKFLGEVLPEQDCRDALQEFFGMVFLDRNTSKMEKMMVLIGGGSNGKSVVFDTIKFVLGVENITSYDIQSLIGVNNTVQYNIADMNGKLLNYNSEMEHKMIDSNKFKSIISGEPTPARVIFKSPFLATSIPLIVANANGYPKTNDYSDGFYRRFLFIPFDVTITADKANHSLPYELQQEASGIFNWLVDGYRRAESKKFKIQMPAKSMLALGQFKDDTNSVLGFMKDKRYASASLYETQGFTFISVSDLYADYKGYCAVAGLMSCSLMEFSKRLDTAKFEKMRKAQGMTFKVFRIPDDIEFVKLKKSGRIKMSKRAFMLKCGIYDAVEVEEEEVVEVKEPEQLIIKTDTTNEECPF